MRNSEQILQKYQVSREHLIQAAAFADYRNRKEEAAERPKAQDKDKPEQERPIQARDVKDFLIAFYNGEHDGNRRQNGRCITPQTKITEKGVGTVLDCKNYIVSYCIAMYKQTSKNRGIGEYEVQYRAVQMLLLLFKPDSEQLKNNGRNNPVVVDITYHPIIPSSALAVVPMWEELEAVPEFQQLCREYDSFVALPEQEKNRYIANLTFCQKLAKAETTLWGVGYGLGLSFIGIASTTVAICAIAPETAKDILTHPGFIGGAAAFIVCSMAIGGLITRVMLNQDGMLRRHQEVCFYTSAVGTGMGLAAISLLYRLGSEPELISNIITAVSSPLGSDMQSQCLIIGLYAVFAVATIAAIVIPQIKHYMEERAKAPTYTPEF